MLKMGEYDEMLAVGLNAVMCKLWMEVQDDVLAMRVYDKRFHVRVKDKVLIVGVGAEVPAIEGTSVETD